VKLYHLTSIYHLPIIMASGFLKLTESNISLVPHEEHKGPDVVWLTTSNRPGQGWASMSRGLGWVDKCRIQFDLELPEEIVHPWYDWALAHGGTDHFMRALATSGDERVGLRQGHLYDEMGDAALELAKRDWFVAERAIPWLEWQSVTDRLAGTVIWQQSVEQQKAGTLRMSRLWLASGAIPTDARVMVSVEPDGKPKGPWVPTTITSEENPGVAIHIGGEGPPDLVIDGRELSDMAHPGEVPPGERLLGGQDPNKMTDAQRRAYFDRVAPSVNVMRDILGLDDQA